MEEVLKLADSKPRIICDVDGCLVPGRGSAWDFSGFSQLAKDIGTEEFGFTLCSGRPATFLEALARQLMINQYCICENGALLFHPLSKKGIIHPAVPKEFLQERARIQGVLEKLIAGTDVVIELGKDIMFSVNSSDKTMLEDLCTTIKEELRNAPVVVVNSSRSIEVLPHGVNKAAGLRFWAEIEQVDFSQILSIGDADNDLEILQAASTAAAPSNCTEMVRKTVDYVSNQPMIQGVLDICSQASSLIAR